MSRICNTGPKFWINKYWTDLLQDFGEKFWRNCSHTKFLLLYLYSSPYTLTDEILVYFDEISDALQIGLQYTIRLKYKFMKVAVRFSVYLLDRTIKMLRGSRIKRFIFVLHTFISPHENNLQKRKRKRKETIFSIVLTQFRSKKGFTKSYVIT